MRAAILAIGDELTSGYRLDTNSQAISARLTPLPMDVVMHISVMDTPEAIKAGLDTTLMSADCVVVTGGLGPTEDDLTRHVIASYYGLELVEDAEALDRMKQRYARRHRRMPESNQSQALVPRGSQVIQNSRGTAAGFYLSVRTKHVFVTPGIPYEMEGMLEGFILPRLRTLVGSGREVRQAFVKVYGLPESEINERIRPMVARGRNPLLGLLPRQGTITIELTASASSRGTADSLLQADIVRLRSALGRHIISEDGRDLPQVAGDLIAGRGLTLGTAEIGTTGLLAARLSESDGSEKWLLGGLVLAGSGSESPDAGAQLAPEQRARDLASMARHSTGADIGVGVGPVQVPEDSSGDRPYGAVLIGIDLLGEVSFSELRFTSDRARLRQWAADAAMAQVRLAILDQP